MFQNPFLFKGRIRRLEYGLSLIFYILFILLMTLFMEYTGLPENIVFFFFIPAYWFMLAQGAKRCHDRGNTGWFQIIPFYGFVMLFGDGDEGMNEYGLNPKGIGNENVEEMIDNIGNPDQDVE